MPRQSPTNQTRQKFLRLFRVPTASGADSSSQFVHSNTVDEALLRDGQQNKHHFYHGFVKTANSEGFGQESQSEKTNPSPRINLLNSANKPPKSGDYILRGAASSNKMGNVQQSESPKCLPISEGYADQIIFGPTLVNPDIVNEGLNSLEVMLTYISKINSGPLEMPYFYLILLVGSQLLYLCLRKWITSDSSADVKRYEIKRFPLARKSGFKPFLRTFLFNHPVGKKFYQFVKCLRFGDSLFPSVFSSNMRLQRTYPKVKPTLLIA
ncbi:hypothetical protein ACTXT7_007697 [Hymenolepis weldensis]